MEKPVDPRETEIERILELLADTTEEAPALEDYRRQAAEFDAGPAAARAALDAASLEPAGAGALLASLRERLASQGESAAAAAIEKGG